jgi:hypothetical protein
MSTIEEYTESVRKFNAYDSFVIHLPVTWNKFRELVEYTEAVKEHTELLKRYLMIRNQGYSDDHLATEIGLFVLHLNQTTLGVERTNEKKKKNE